MIKRKLEEFIRVNHAGEYGAQQIYKGQIKALKLKNDNTEIFEHMKSQEDVHYDYFNQKIIKNEVRPTLMQPIWQVGGYALGFISAIAGKRMAMLCTSAVEEVIDEHYKSQINFIEDELKNAELDIETYTLKEELLEKIKKFREEEVEHRDIGYEGGARDIKNYNIISKGIKFITKFAIETSKKI